MAARRPSRPSYAVGYFLTHKAAQGKCDRAPDGSAGATLNLLDGSWTGQVTPVDMHAFWEVVASDAKEGRYGTYLSENGTTPVTRAFADVDGTLLATCWSTKLVLHLGVLFRDALHAGFPGGPRPAPVAPLAAFDVVYVAVPARYMLDGAAPVIARNLKPDFTGAKPRKLGVHLVAPNAVMTSYQLFLIGAEFKRAVAAAYPHDAISVDLAPYISTHLRPLYCDRPAPCPECPSVTGGAVTSASCCLNAADTGCVNRRRPRGTVYVPALVVPPAATPDAAIQGLVKAEMTRLKTPFEALLTYSIRATPAQLKAGPTPGFSLEAMHPHLAPIPSFASVAPCAEAGGAPAFHIERATPREERNFVATLEATNSLEVRAAQALIDRYVVHDPAGGEVLPYAGAPPSVMKYAGTVVSKLQRDATGTWTATLLGGAAKWCENKGGEHECGKETRFLLRDVTVESRRGVQVLAICGCRSPATRDDRWTCSQWTSRRKSARFTRVKDNPNFFVGPPELPILFPPHGRSAGTGDASRTSDASNTSRPSVAGPASASPEYDFDAWVLSPPAKRLRTQAPPVAAPPSVASTHSTSRTWTPLSIPATLHAAGPSSAWHVGTQIPAGPLAHAAERARK